MVPDIHDDLTTYILASFFIITHGLSFKKTIFLKDSYFFLKDKK